MTEIEKKATQDVAEIDITAAEMYIRGDYVRYIARTLGMNEDATRNAIDRAVATHEPTQDKLNVARADVTDVIKRINDALDSGQVRYNSQAFHSLLARRMQARGMLDKYNGLDTPPPQPRLAITLRDLVLVREGKQEPLPDHEEQEAILAEILEEGKGGETIE